MKYFRVVCKRTVTEEIFVYADDALQAEVRATVGGLDRVRQKEGVLAVAVTETPTKESFAVTEISYEDLPVSCRQDENVAANGL